MAIPTGSTLPSSSAVGDLFILTANNWVYRCWVTNTWQPYSPPAVWGNIAGTLSNQTDVSNAIAAAGGGLPAGVIVMWSGLLSAIPPGWLLCDGTNGTPDLRSRFIQGAAAGQDPGATGGSATHTHNNHVVTQPSDHVINQVLNHTHPIVDPGHNHTQNSFAPRIVNSGSAGTVGVQGASTASNANASNAATTATNQSATTGISTSNPAGGVASITLAHAGSAVDAHSVANNLPPFFALAFIMKAA